MPASSELHFEPFVHLAGLTHDDALIAWGGFWFERPPDSGEFWRIVEDPDLRSAGVGRRQTVGVSSASYGPSRVEVVEEDTGRVAAEATTDGANHVWVRGLRPDTRYRYRIEVDGSPWADQPLLRCQPDHEAGIGRFRLVEDDRRYDNRFRTFPAPDERAAVTFAVLGDFGVGVLASEGRGARQRHLAASLERAVEHHDVRLVITTGDNVYIGDEDTAAGSGEHDDDWYFSFYEPYRHVINRVPVFPAIGNHDASDTERSDDRGQVADNMFTDLRFRSEAEVGRASVDPGLFYRFDVGADVEFVCIDTTLASGLDYDQYFQAPEHRDFLEEAFPETGHTPGEPHPRWRIPFGHHPPFCAGPSHPNMAPMIEDLVPLFERSGVRLVLAGHEHNLQISERHGITYLVSGAAGKLREDPPDRFDEAHTTAWAAAGHFLLVEIDGGRADVHPVSAIDDDGRRHEVELRAPDGSPVHPPVEIRCPEDQLAGEARR